MKLGRVTGTVVTTICTKVDEDRKLLLCDLLGDDDAPSGDYVVAVDTVGAGAGERVLILDEGNGARQVLDFENGEVRAVVVGIVDRVDTV